MVIDGKNYLTIGQAAKLIGCKNGSIRVYVHRGDIDGKNIGGGLFVVAESAASYAARVKKRRKSA